MTHPFAKIETLKVIGAASHTNSKGQHVLSQQAVIDSLIERDLTVRVQKEDLGPWNVFAFEGEYIPMKAGFPMLRNDEGRVLLVSLHGENELKSENLIQSHFVWMYVNIESGTAFPSLQTYNDKTEAGVAVQELTGCDDLLGFKTNFSPIWFGNKSIPNEYSPFFAV